MADDQKQIARQQHAHSPRSGLLQLLAQRNSDMQTADSISPITAIVYSDGPHFEIFLQEITAALADKGLRLGGLVQHSRPNPHRVKCDMYLRDLATGELYAISDDRGPHARGCVLNTDRLLYACQKAQTGLSSRTDLLVLCKFGKTEVEGGGFRTLIAKALELSIPILIGVPLINLVPFREFSAGFAREVELSQFVTDRCSIAERLVWPLVPETEGTGRIA